MKLYTSEQIFRLANYNLISKEADFFTKLPTCGFKSILAQNVDFIDMTIFLPKPTSSPACNL